MWLWAAVRRLAVLVYLASWWTRPAASAKFLAQCRSDDESLTVWCERANLTVVPHMLNPLVRRLYLAHNRIAGLAGQTFGMYRELVFLDLSRNTLGPNLEQGFVHQAALKVLRLDSNRLVRLEQRAFEGLHSLQLLRLDHNLLASLPPSVFRNLSSLEVLDLSSNRLVDVDPLAFDGLSNLLRLILRDNLLAIIPSASFQRLENLQALDLGLNALRRLPGNAFFPLRRLKMLNLDGCELDTIQPGAFKNLEQLKIMHLQNNDLQNIPMEALIDASRMEELHLGQNRIGKLPTFAFEGLQYLQVIVINRDESLSRIEKGAFSGNDGLERVYITHNRRLTFIHPDAFKGIVSMRFVSLRGNQLAGVEEELLPWDRLEGFDLRDNPLQCNCSVAWLWSAIRAANMTEEPVFCSSPPHLRGLPLREASPVDLDCGAEARRRGRILAATGAAAGLALLLAALAGLLWTRQHAASRQAEWKTDLQHKVSPITDL